MRPGKNRKIIYLAALCVTLIFAAAAIVLAFRTGNTGSGKEPVFETIDAGAGSEAYLQADAGQNVDASGAEAAGTSVSSASETASEESAETGTTETEEKNVVPIAPEKKKYASSSMPEYVRGAWVAGVGEYRDFPSVQTSDSESLKKDCDRILDKASEIGINVIFFHVRPSSDAFYASSLYPWSRYLTGVQGLAPSGGFDPLAYMTEGAHARGIQLHAWINPYRIRTDDAACKAGASAISLETLTAGNPALASVAGCILP